MRPGSVVIGDPGIDELASLVEIVEQALIEKLVAHPAVEGLNVAVLYRSRRSVRPESPTQITMLKTPQATVAPLAAQLLPFVLW